MRYDDYEHLLFDRKPNGVLLVTLNRPEVMNATNARLHWELTKIWRTIDEDAETRVVVITGAGKAFSAGGDIEVLEQMVGNAEGIEGMMREAAAIPYEMTALDKPVISAINGVAVGAGLAVALMADISIMSETAKFTDGHVKLGVCAGDHAAMVWPLLTSLTKARYYLLTAEFLDGKEAERIGLVTFCEPAERVLPRALEIADKLGRGSQPAIRGTKRALANWVRMAGPIFDNSLALEMLTFLGPDAAEGVKALREKRAPEFPSTKT